MPVKKTIDGKVRGRLYKKKKLTENPLIVDYFFFANQHFQVEYEPKNKQLLI